ncbi:hypothetical protein Tco_0987327 [Tanacetum coccineum]
MLGTLRWSSGSYKKIIIELEEEVLSLLQKEKENMEIIESLKSKGSESSENAISNSENQSENDCHEVEKKVFESTISKLENELAQRVKDFDDTKIELSNRTDKFETYFANLEKENALLKSQLASQNYTSLQKENNDLRTSYNVLKETHETFYENLEKENNDLKMHYKRLFDSIK